MLREEMIEVQKSLVVYGENQGENFLATNGKVGMRAKYIDIRHDFYEGHDRRQGQKTKYIRSKETLRIL